MIRAMRPEDAPELVRLGQVLHDTSSYAALPFNAEKVETFLLGLTTLDNGVVYVAEVDGRIVGGMAGGIVDQWFADYKTAFDYSVFIDPKYRNGLTSLKLLHAFFEWAKTKGADEIRLGITTGLHLQGTSEFYRWLGFEYTGVMFRMEVKHGG